MRLDFCEFIGYNQSNYKDTGCEEKQPFPRSKERRRPVRVFVREAALSFPSR